MLQQILRTVLRAGCMLGFSFFQISCIRLSILPLYTFLRVITISKFAVKLDLQDLLMTLFKFLNVINTLAQNDKTYTTVQWLEQSIAEQTIIEPTPEEEESETFHRIRLFGNADAWNDCMEKYIQERCQNFITHNLCHI